MCVACVEIKRTVGSWGGALRWENKVAQGGRYGGQWIARAEACHAHTIHISCFFCLDHHPSPVSDFNISPSLHPQPPPITTTTTTTTMSFRTAFTASALRPTLRTTPRLAFVPPRAAPRTFSSSPRSLAQAVASASYSSGGAGAGAGAGAAGAKTASKGNGRKWGLRIGE